MQTKMVKTDNQDKPCVSYLKTGHCKDGRDHCYNCARHLDGNGLCSKGCK